MAFFLAFPSGGIRRCALPYLSQPGKTPPSPLSNPAVRQMAETVKSFETEHFAIWWPTNSSLHGISALEATTLPGDSVPELVRLCATALEKARRGYVDTLGYSPPSGSSTSLYWRRPVPAGKYPVELCDVYTAVQELGYALDKGAVYGVALTDGPTNASSGLLLASRLSSFGSWGFARDADGGGIGTVYAQSWRDAMKATCAHELFHAIQYKYETQTDRHSFFEASAIAMEPRMVPESMDYLYYSQTLARLGTGAPFPTGIRSDAYPHGWMVRSMMDDLGIEVVKSLWESRQADASHPRSFVSTLRQVLPGSPFFGSFDAELARNAMRLALTGKRSSWSTDSLPLFPDASQFPVLEGTLADAATPTPLPLELGAFQIRIDTVPSTTDRVLVWIPEQGVLMGRAANTPAGTKVSWHPGSVRCSSSDATRSAWVFANPGNPVALRPYATTESSTSTYRSMAAPVRTAAQAGQKLTWTSPDGLVLTGTSRTETLSTPLLHLDVWKPSSAKDPFAARTTRGTAGHAIVLEDADRVLSLSGARLRWDAGTVVSAYQGSGDGLWRPLDVTEGVISLGELDLSRPTRILVSGTGSTQPVSRLPRPNPSRRSDPIHFPILGASGSETLTVLSADGGVVREFHPDPSQTEVVWDLRNRESRKVRPGVYTWIWRGVDGARQGRVLVAE